MGWAFLVVLYWDGWDGKAQSYSTPKLQNTPDAQSCLNATQLPDGSA